MRAKGIVLGLSLLAAGPAAADDFYVSAFGGINLLADQDAVVSQPMEPDFGVTFINRNGMTLGGAVGYAFELGEGFALSLEGEVSWRSNNDDKFHNKAMDFSAPQEGDNQVLAGMGNLVLGYSFGDGWGLHLGGGVGYASWTLRSNGGGPIGPLGDTEGGLAWQGFGGLDYEVAAGFHVGLEYRFFAVQDQTFDIDFSRYEGPGSVAVLHDVNYDSHSILVTGRVELGPLLRAFGVR